MATSAGHYLAFSGGVGGAKLALGLSRCLAPEQLTVIANTGDDFQHFGLHISPDLDTLMYTLAGVSNIEQGWGQQRETWNFLTAMEALGEDCWFRLGDRDLATHVLRTQWLQSGRSLSEVTLQLCAQLGVAANLLPMTDDPVRTWVRCTEEVIPFQHYFVKRRCQPEVSGFQFRGIEQARPQPRFLECLNSANLKGVIICPSNPFVSVDPLLHLPGIRELLQASAAPIVAVSPLVGGRAIKGPLAKMMAELGMPVTATAVARHYRGLIDCFVVDEGDATLAGEIEDLGMQVAVTQTIMHSLEERVALAEFVIDQVSSLGGVS